jgi:hypothetical protein
LFRGENFLIVTYSKNIICMGIDERTQINGS